MSAVLIGYLMLYNLFILLGAIPALPWIVFQYTVVAKRRIGLGERLGRAPLGDGRVVWVHAVSVGEVRAIVPMMKILKDGLGPDDRLFLSTVTVTGQEMAERECREADRIFFFPLDLPFAVMRAMKRVNPSVFVTVETEFWPNFLAACFHRKVPVVVVNGRISDHSYFMYRIFRWFFRALLEKVRFFFVQSELDAKRVVGIGARPESVVVTGNTKYDRTPLMVEIPQSVLSWRDGSPVLVAGSTHHGEEDVMIESVFQRDMEERGLKLILVPRHPERFDEVEALLKKKGIIYTRYSRMQPNMPVEGRVLLVDAMGQLDSFYGMSDISFVGGSLVPVGGHNLLEPAMLGKPVLTGPYMQNFRDVTSTLVEAGGARIVKDAHSLVTALAELLDHPAKRKEMGRAARKASEGTMGASKKNAEKILSLLTRAA